MWNFRFTEPSYTRPPCPEPSRLLLPAVLLLALAVAGCGSDSSAKPAAKATSTPTDPAQEVDRMASQISTKLSQRPKIPTPKGTPPSELIAKDIVKGTGPKVKPGDKLSVQYVRRVVVGRRGTGARPGTAGRRSGSRSRARSSRAGTRASSACARAAAGCSSSRR